MTTEKTPFHEALLEAELTIKQFSEISNTPFETVYSWVTGKRRTPGIAFSFLYLFKRIKFLANKK